MNYATCTSICGTLVVKICPSKNKVDISYLKISRVFFHSTEGCAHSATGQSELNTVVE